MSTMVLNEGEKKLNKPVCSCGGQVSTTINVQQYLATLAEVFCGFPTLQV